MRHGVSGILCKRDFSVAAASAAGKIVNITTNLAALLFFISSGNVLY
jgi:hypothetical protein